MSSVSLPFPCQMMHGNSGRMHRAWAACLPHLRPLELTMFCGCVACVCPTLIRSELGKRNNKTLSTPMLAIVRAMRPMHDAYIHYFRGVHASFDKRMEDQLATAWPPKSGQRRTGHFGKYQPIGQTIAHVYFQRLCELFDDYFGFHGGPACRQHLPLQLPLLQTVSVFLEFRVLQSLAIDGFVQIIHGISIE